MRDFAKGKRCGMSSEKKAKWTAKRIVAIIAIVLLVGMYVGTFFVALFYPADAASLFGACLMATVVIPVLAWVFIWLYGQITGKETIADLKILQTGDMADDKLPEE